MIFVYIYYLQTVNVGTFAMYLRILKKNLCLRFEPNIPSHPPQVA